MASEKSPPFEDAYTRIPLRSIIGFKVPPDDKLPLFTQSHDLSRSPSPWRRVVFVVVTICLLIAFVPGTPLPPLLSRHSSVTHSGSILINVTHGAVASENKLCSEIGVKVLQDSGNAVDAAISATICMGALNMFSSGIGGGGFMTVRLPPNGTRKTSEVYTIDFRETAPKLANETMYVGRPEKASIGGLAVGVPGELRGLEEAHRRWNSSLSWERLVQPTVKLATGWTVGAELARRIQMYPKLMLENKEWSVIFAPNGKLLVQGDAIQNQNLSRTLGIIAKEGPGAFYKGPIADSIVRRVNETDGILTHEDLEGYRVKVDRAVEGTYRNKTVYTAGFPTSGPVLLHMLNLLGQHPFVPDNRTTRNLHLIIEAMKFGFAARTRIGDPAYYQGNISHMEEIPTEELAKEIAGYLTDNATHPPEYYKPECGAKVGHGTAHVSVVDKDGMAVALTTTVNEVFGSQVLDPETGVILNDEMDDFSIPGVPPCPLAHNYPEPGKRPTSSTSPTIMENADGSFYLAIGAAGGPQIFPSVFQTFLNLEWGMNPAQAIDHGRLQDQLFPVHPKSCPGDPKSCPDEVVAESDALTSEEKDGLQKLGHYMYVLPPDTITSVVQVVQRKDGRIYAASDARKHGVAAGY